MIEGLRPTEFQYFCAASNIPERNRLPKGSGAPVINIGRYPFVSSIWSLKLSQRSLSTWLNTSYADCVADFSLLFMRCDRNTAKEDLPEPYGPINAHDLGVFSWSKVSVIRCSVFTARLVGIYAFTISSESESRSMFIDLV